MKTSVLAHADDYGIKDIDWLFPEAKTFQDKPEFISRKMEWVSAVMDGVHKSPFSRIKSVFADITADEARAKGYMKGDLKENEVFTLLRRTTEPCTIYKKQQLDRDDVIDITDFDVVAWIKAEMRIMLDEEIARAILVGDGRLNSDDDKIKEDCVRPIWKEADLFCLKKEVTIGKDDDETAKNFIRACIKSRKDYRGSGSPILFTTEDFLTDMLLLEDSIGHALYPTEQALATKLRVSKIVTVPVMENLTRPVTKSGTAYTNTLMGIIVNLNDYNVGADKGGSISMFDDFDIDFNQQKYLMETRISGALTKPYSAIVLEKSVQGAG
jgi:HK97 family phage major capsid protein